MSTIHEFIYAKKFTIDLAKLCRLAKPNPGDAFLLGRECLDVFKGRMIKSVGLPADARRLVGILPVTYRAEFTGDTFVYFRMEFVREGLFNTRCIVTLLRL